MAIKYVGLYVTLCFNSVDKDEDGEEGENPALDSLAAAIQYQV